jgi:hypothetical protein
MYSVSDNSALVLCAKRPLTAVNLYLSVKIFSSIICKMNPTERKDLLCIYLQRSLHNMILGADPRIAAYATIYIVVLYLVG